MKWQFYKDDPLPEDKALIILLESDDRKAHSLEDVTFEMHMQSPYHRFRCISGPYAGNFVDTNNWEVIAWREK